MKTAIILFFLSVSAAFSQVDCAEQKQDFTGECESYNSRTGVRSAYNFKEGKLHGKFEESYENGQRRSTGSYKLGLLSGKFQAFYSTGEKLSEGKFKNGSGAFTMFHKNGENKALGEFSEGNPSGKWKFYTDKGELNREVESSNVRVNMYSFLVGEEQVRQRQNMFDDFFDMDGSGFSFSFGGDTDSAFAQMRVQMEESMQRMQAQMDQMMQNFSDSSFSRSFKFDTIITFDNHDDNGAYFEFKSFGDSSFSDSFDFDSSFGNPQVGANPYFNTRETDLVDFPDTEPEFIGGEDAQNSYIEQEVRSSNLDNADQREGTVFIEAIIEKDGSISNARVALGVNDTFDKKALEIVQEMPLWKPATLDGQSVRSRCIVPILF